MAAFGAVPGLTIFTLAAVIILGGTYLGAAYYVSFAGAGQSVWKRAIVPVCLMFVLTTVLALLSAIAENQFVNRVTGG
ncbi:MAG TPA: hypothetical protein VI138_05265 [Candidatus Dormibacteraeota bacterium]